MSSPSGASRLGKRTLDFTASAAVLLLASPLLLAIAGLILWTDGGPVFFSQRRPGLGGRAFSLLKFRTMRSLPAATDAERLTSLGRFLRATSLDELPEFWNVLRGEMSLVGPRSLLMKYLAHYSPTQARRHEVLPGITGWAQINGRNLLSWEEKFAHDVWYVERRGFWLDLKILFLTLPKVWRREGVSARGSATMPEFRPRDNS